MIDLVAVVTSTAGEASAGDWLLLLAVVAGFFAARAQLNPYTRCRKCRGRAPSDKSGQNYHRCRRCKGKPERLRFGAWAMLRLGIPVPRVK